MKNITVLTSKELKNTKGAAGVPYGPLPKDVKPGDSGLAFVGTLVLCQ